MFFLILNFNVYIYSRAHLYWRWNIDFIGICSMRWKLNKRLGYLTLIFDLVTILSLPTTTDTNKSWSKRKNPYPKNNNLKNVSKRGYTNIHKNFYPNNSRIGKLKINKRIWYEKKTKKVILLSVWYISYFQSLNLNLQIKNHFRSF